MPTGYTADIAKGITFNEFILSCARNFGACITMRDEPSGTEIPEEFEASAYHTDELNKAKLRYLELVTYSNEQLRDFAADSYREALTDFYKRVDERNDLEDKYLAMLEESRTWNPPSEDHQGLKNFMVKQIQESIDFDCSRKYDMPEEQTDIAWLAEQLKKTQWNIEYHAKEAVKEQERVDNRNKWIKQLRDSLE